MMLVVLLFVTPVLLWCGYIYPFVLKQNIINKKLVLLFLREKLLEAKKSKKIQQRTPPVRSRTKDTFQHLDLQVEQLNSSLSKRCARVVDKFQVSCRQCLSKLKKIQSKKDSCATLAVTRCFPK
jgi:hypothetical protein